MIVYSNDIVEYQGNIINFTPSQIYHVYTSATHGTIGATPSSGTPGTIVTIYSVPDMGYQFDHYLINGVSSTSHSFVLMEDTYVEAVFTEIDYTVTTSGVNGFVLANPNHGTHGTTITLTNQGDNGYYFDYYATDGPEITNGEFNIEYSDVSVTGYFYKPAYFSSIGRSALHCQLIQVPYLFDPQGAYTDPYYYLQPYSTMTPVKWSGDVTVTTTDDGDQYLAVYRNPNVLNDGCTSLTVNTGYHSYSVFGDNCFNSINTLTFNSQHGLCVGDNSLNATSQTTTRLPSQPYHNYIQYIGNNSMRNVNLTCNIGILYIGSNSLRTLTITSSASEDLRIVLGGAIGSDVNVTPFIGQAPTSGTTGQGFYLFGDVKAAVQAWLTRTANAGVTTKFMHFSQTPSTQTQIICLNCSDADITWLNSNFDTFASYTTSGTWLTRPLFRKQ